jgi:hypothetical protein
VIPILSTQVPAPDVGGDDVADDLRVVLDLDLLEVDEVQLDLFDSGGHSFAHQFHCVEPIAAVDKD